MPPVRKMDKSRHTYHDDFAKMRALINEFDPCSFINGGAPNHEYDNLTQKMLSLIYVGNTRDEIKKMITSDLEFYYGCVNDTMFQNKESERQFKADLDTFLEKVQTTFADKKRNA
jgi:hypothetical protein